MRRSKRSREHRWGRARPDRRIVAFFGLFGVGNYGNEASLEAGIRSARRIDPDADLRCICANPELVAAQHGLATESIVSSGRVPSRVPGPRIVRLATRPVLERARWIEAYRISRRVSSIIVPGTGILDDFGVRPLEMPYDLFRWCLAARLARTPMSFVSVGAGPIEHPLSRWFMRAAVRLSTYHSYRDHGSRSFMVSIGSDGAGDRVMPDVVFGLSLPESGPPRASTHVGLGVMAYYGWANDPSTGEAVFQTYMGKIAQLARRLIDAGHTVRLLVGEDSDERAVALLVESLRSGDADFPEDRLIREPITSLHDLFGQIARTDAVIATRFHNVLGAVMMERPTVSIGYAEKNVELMESMGLGDFCHHVDRFEVDHVLDDFAALMDRWDDLAHGVHEQNVVNARLVEEQFELVLGPSPTRHDNFPLDGTTKGTT